MIKEAYCSKEVSILLKEKGFNEKCRGGYHYEFDDNDNPIVMFEEWMTQPYNNDFVDEGFLCSAPTHQMAMAWLREKYNVVIVIDVCRETGREGFYCWQLEDNRTGDWIVNIVGECPTYEQACEEALKYCLEKIIK